MKIIIFTITLIFLIAFPSITFAKDELVMEKELMWWAINGQSGDSACFQLIYIEVGRDVPDMRDELLAAACGLTDGKYSLTLTGSPGTTVTFFGNYNFKKGNENNIYFNYFKGLSLKAAGKEERAIKTFQDLAKINFSAWEIAIVKRLAQKQLSGV